MDAILFEIYMIIYEFRKFQNMYNREHKLLMSYLKDDFKKQNKETNFKRWCKEKIADLNFKKIEIYII